MGGLGHSRVPTEWGLGARQDGDLFVAVARDYQLTRIRPDLPLVRVTVSVDVRGDYWGWYAGTAKLPIYLTPDLGELEATLARSGTERTEGRILRFSICLEQYGTGS